MENSLLGDLGTCLGMVREVRYTFTLKYSISGWLM